MTRGFRSGVALLIAAFLASSPAKAQECEKVSEPGARLRCYDALKAPASGPSAKAPDASAFPARSYNGPVVFPDFARRDRAQSQFRTRIREGMKGGPNFAGRMAVIVIGCGAGCRFAPVADVSTGQVFDFPLGGEDAMYLDLDYRLDSRLIRARWETDRCMQAFYEWTGQTFRLIEKRDLGPADTCRTLN